MIFPIPKSKFKLLELIYNSPGLGISELLKKASVSPKAGYKYLKELSNAKIIIQETTGKKPLLKRTFPNLRSEEGRLMFSLLEGEEKNKFLNRHKELIGSFEQMIGELGKKVYSILVFGSYARGSETADSDLDILFIGDSNVKKTVEDISERIFVTLKTRVSLRIISKKEFLELKERDEMIKSIIKDHICVLKPENYIGLIS